MGALDLVLLEALAVLGQSQALQPITHVVFVPQAEGPLPPWPQGQQGPAKDRGGAGGGVGRGRRRAGPGPGTGAPHDETDLLGFRREAQTGRLQDGQASTRAQVRALGAGGGGGGEPHRPVGGGGGRGGATAGDGVATSWSDRVAGAVSSLGDGVELPQAGEQPAGPRERDQDQDLSFRSQQITYVNNV